MNDVILWIVVATALAFDFTNGFHDTANAIAASISTRAMAPRVAVAMAAAGIAILVTYRVVGRQRPGVVSRGFRIGQLASSALLSLSHGTNDAQKTMGILFLALVANGNVAAGADVPTWVVVSAATAIAAGTYVGGWRIIRTMGSRIIKMDPAQGFAAQTAGAAVILSATHFGFQLSTHQL